MPSMASLHDARGPDSGTLSPILALLLMIGSIFVAKVRVDGRTAAVGVVMKWGADGLELGLDLDVNVLI
ncbi:hypothetical protein DL95DRAFT_149034 [Leptodontidium sp. 2 PMI_412]|nr:hypothetical protein DL95DRAFT_149034 [Leptodontidium sp. 2 PMI_412]